MSGPNRTEPTEPTVWRLVAYSGAIPEHIRVVICGTCKSVVTDQVTHDAVLHTPAKSSVEL